MRTIDGHDAASRIFFSGKSHVYTDRLPVRILACLTDNDLDNLSVLSKIFVSTQSVEQFVLPYCGCETGHINKVLLDNPQPGEVLATERIGLGFLGFFLAQCLGFLCL